MIKLIEVNRGLSVAERRQFGKARRRALPRVEQARWQPRPGRPDPVGLLVQANCGRVPELLPIKYGRMSISPFGFFRGAAPVMADDLGRLPVSGLQVRICGDAHLRNLGAYAALDEHLVFDINDFDESVRGPWEWDLKRLATSVILAARNAGVPDAGGEQAVRALAAAYRESMHEFAEMPALELFRHPVQRYLRAAPLHPVLLQARRATLAQVRRKLVAVRRSGAPRFRTFRPILVPVPPAAARKVIAALGTYRDLLDAGCRAAFDSYRPADIAFKVVGTGSVGTRDYVFLLVGINADDLLFLQVKEELPSCWSPYLGPASVSCHQGRRAADGQHALQTLSDPLLGWTTIDGREYLVRQLADHKASVDLEHLDGRGLVEYVRVCGEAFAKGHARSGDPAALAGYLGTTDRFDRALTRFAVAYADQTAADYDVFMRAIRKRTIPARRGV
jgi:uncharacterized protein (DUF2252 family)